VVYDLDNSPERVMKPAVRALLGVALFATAADAGAQRQSWPTRPAG
jgi:hypothetical protein